MKRYIVLLLAVIFLVASGVLYYATRETKTEWKEMAPGLKISLIKASVQKQEPKSLVVAIIDPLKYDLQIVQNTSRVEAKTIEKIHEENHSFLTFNGNFFTKDFKPTGLLISQEKLLHKSSEAELLNGIFTIDKNNRPKLYDPNQITDMSPFIFAIQNGPILLNEKREIGIKSDDHKKASRTAIGLDKDGKIVVIILKQTFFNRDNMSSLYEFAQLLKDSPEFRSLSLHSVLNLDGGPSTGMKTGEKYYAEIDIPQNIVIVTPKKR